MSDHTPGPWKYSFETIDPEWAVVTMKGGAVVANVNSNGQQEANARLISAAPELLEALNRLVVAAGEADALQHAGMKVPSKVWAEIYAANIQARAAIDKATGK